MKSFFPIAPKSLISDHVAECIEKAIVGGSLKPGEKLSLEALASQFRVSQIPVREALNRLAAQGLVVRKPNQGMFVVQLTLEEMLMILEVRDPMEGLAARLAAERALPEEVTALRKFVRTMETALKNHNSELYCVADVDFHRKLWSCSRNPFLQKSLAALMFPWYGFQMAAGLISLDSTLDACPSLHERIVDAIENRDPDEAEQSIVDLSLNSRMYISHKQEELRAAAKQTEA